MVTVFLDGQTPSPTAFLFEALLTVFGAGVSLFCPLRQSLLLLTGRCLPDPLLGNVHLYKIDQRKSGKADINSRQVM